MTESNASRVKLLFAETMDLADADASAVLDARCGPRSPDRDEVEALLRCHRRQSRFLDPATAAAAAAPSSAAAASAAAAAPADRVRWLLLGEEPGSTVDRYTLVDVLGEGGFGVVFRAEQTRPVRRTVALKVVKAGMESAAVMRRFEAERQALAAMDHPNVARLLDAGTTDRGRPYFVMELIDGRPITDHAAAAALAVRQRVELFVPVCRAVHHAHQKGVLHRDLKPSNLLVAGGVPKVIDFGIAKAIAGTASAGLTEQRQVVGTPRYMSPEQAETGGSQVDTRSDVYSLGAVLRELLGPVAGGRDLGWVVGKATDADRGRRYDSAAALGDDLQNYLDGRPVRAGPPGVAYRARKFVGRHRTAAVLVVAAAASLLTCLAVTGVSYARVRASRDRVVAAESVATEKLRESYLLQARAGRQTARPGQRIDGLAVLAAAGRIRPGPDLDDEVIACLAVPDVERVRDWPCGPGRRMLAFAPAMDRYARVEADGGVTVRRTTGDGRPVASFPAPARTTCTKLRFGPGGRFLCAEYDRADFRIRVWDTAADKPPVVAVDGPPASNDFTGDGRSLVVAGSAGTVDAYDLAAGRRTASIPAGGDVDLVCCQPNGDGVAVFGRTGGLRVLRTSGPADVRPLRTAVDTVMAVAWHPDGRRIAVGGAESYTVEVIDVPTAVVQATMQGHIGAVVGLAFADAGQLLVSGSWDGTLKVWDAPTGKQMLTVDGFESELEAAADGRTVCFLRLNADAFEHWRLVPSDVCRSYSGLKQDVGNDAAAFSPDGDLMATAAGTGVRLWSLSRGYGWVGYAAVAAVRSTAFSRDGRRLWIGTPDGVRSLDVGELARRDDPLADRVSDGSTAAVAASADGTTLVFGDAAGTVWTSPADDAARKVRLGPHASPPRYAAVSPDGRWAMTSRRWDSTFAVWDLPGKRLLKTLPVTPGALEAGDVAFSPDGRRAVTADMTAYAVWRLPDWTLERRLPRPRGFGAGLVAFSPDGRQVALAGRGYSVKLVDPVTLADVATLDTPVPHMPCGLTFSPDGGRLAVSGQDGFIVVWDLRQVRTGLAANHRDPPATSPSRRPS